MNYFLLYLSFPATYLFLWVVAGPDGNEEITTDKVRELVFVNAFWPVMVPVSFLIGFYKCFIKWEW